MEFFQKHLVCLIFVYWVIGVGFSIFYGVKAVDIFKAPQSLCCQFFHQFWFNFIGSITGWFILFYLIFIKSKFLTLGYEISLTEIPLVIIAILGIVGLLPYTLAKLTNIK